MSNQAAPAGNEASLLRRTLNAHRKVTGEPLVVWAIVALTSFVAQIVLHRELQPGEFGTMNTMFGTLGLMIVPVIAVKFAFAQFPEIAGSGKESARNDALRGAELLVTETFTWFWAVLSCLLIFGLMNLLHSPRFSLQLFLAMNVLVALGGLLSQSICASEKTVRLWIGLVVASALVRAIASAGFANYEPVAEAAQAALVVAGFITLAPAMRARESDLVARLAACRAASDRGFLVYTGAALSVFLALFLFSSADRIVAQRWFDLATNSNVSLVDWPKFDAYQTAGLVGRGLLWATQPLLWALFIDRSRIEHTDKRSLKFFWIYVGALLIGALGIGLLSYPLAALFCGVDFQPTAKFIPTFVVVMIPLGLLQAIGMFALASRRYPECFVLGGCSVIYALALYLFGHQPEVMLSYMFGAAVVSLMIVLFVGVVRWGRKQP